MGKGVEQSPRKEMRVPVGKELHRKEQMRLTKERGKERSRAEDGEGK